MSLRPEAKYASVDDLGDFTAAYVDLIKEQQKLIKYQIFPETYFMPYDFCMKELASHCPLYNLILCQVYQKDNIVSNSQGFS